MDLVKLEDVSFSYPDNLVLNKVNFTIKEGEFSAIIGNNGSGKSTLIKLILGELEAKTGNIEIFGQRLKNNLVNPRISYVPQIGLGDNSSFPASCLEIVSSSLYKELGFLKKLDKNHIKEAEDALEAVGMLDFKSRLFGHLSGGQKRRILLARALVNKPKLLILDEPTAGVDSLSTEVFYKLLSSLHQERSMSIIIVTHEIEKLYKLVDRVFCLEESYLLELSKDQIEHEISHKHSHPPIERRI